MKKSRDRRPPVHRKRRLALAAVLVVVAAGCGTGAKLTPTAGKTAKANAPTKTTGVATTAKAISRDCGRLGDVRIEHPTFEVITVSLPCATAIAYIRGSIPSDWHCGPDATVIHESACWQGKDTVDAVSITKLLVCPAGQVGDPTSNTGSGCVIPVGPCSYGGLTISVEPNNRFGCPAAREGLSYYFARIGRTGQTFAYNVLPEDGSGSWSCSGTPYGRGSCTGAGYTFYWTP